MRHDKRVNNIAISVDNVKKQFNLPNHKDNSLKELFTNSIKKKDKGKNVYEALKGISFEVKQGEFFGIVGRNGAGKSTLLRILAQIYRPSSGTVKVKGRLVPFIELGVGFNNNLTGRQNVYLNGAILGFSKKEIDERYETIVEFAELRPFMDQKLKNYSSGMRVRLAFSVAIQADADILLLDEVLAVGDMEFKKKCYSYFDTLKKNKKTIIFVSHGMGAIREYCDRGILIENGKVAFEGSADELADEYMRLFQDKDKNKHKDRGDDRLKNRWGSREVYIHDLDFDQGDDVLKITAHLRSGDTAIDSIRFGMTVRDEKGAIIAGFSNLNVNNSEEITFKANQHKRLEFEIANIFGNRRYSITATLISNDGATVYDKWNDILTFTNNRDNVFYPILCPGKLKISNE